LKLKILGLGVLAVMATSAFAAMNASATVSGHFTNEASDGHAAVTGTENATHFTEFISDAGSVIRCTKASYSGTVTQATVQSITITPKYDECETPGENPTPVTVTMNGCDYTFFSNATTHGTVAIDCGPNNSIEIHHPNCTMTVPAQVPGATITKGITYTTTVEGKHTLTANVTVEEITTEYHGGICIFLGTNHKFKMIGSATISAENTAGQQVGITST
jgi:hypothetical protein